jgi:pimeloyl-ACP methyl ester carboxylesterase
VAWRPAVRSEGVGAVPGSAWAPGGGTVPDDEVVLETADGVRLRGRWWRSRWPARATTVMAHGFASSSDDADVRALAADLQGAGFDVLTYDARGHGRSEGTCTVGDRERLDVAAAAAAVTRGPVILLGHSMGAVAALGHLIGWRDRGRALPMAGLVLVSTPARWRRLLSPRALVRPVARGPLRQGPGAPGMGAHLSATGPGGPQLGPRGVRARGEGPTDPSSRGPPAVEQGTRASLPGGGRGDGPWSGPGCPSSGGQSRGMGQPALSPTTRPAR